MMPGDKIRVALMILDEVLGPSPLMSDAGPTNCEECEYKDPSMAAAVGEGWCYMFRERVECCAQFHVKGKLSS